MLKNPSRVLAADERRFTQIENNELDPILSAFICVYPRLRSVFQQFNGRFAVGPEMAFWGSRPYAPAVSSTWKLKASFRAHNSALVGNCGVTAAADGATAKKPF